MRSVFVLSAANPARPRLHTPLPQQLLFRPARRATTSAGCSCPVRPLCWVGSLVPTTMTGWPHRLGAPFAVAGQLSQERGHVHLGEVGIAEGVEAPPARAGHLTIER